MMWTMKYLWWCGQWNTCDGVDNEMRVMVWTMKYLWWCGQWNASKLRRQRDPMDTHWHWLNPILKGSKRLSLALFCSLSELNKFVATHTFSLAQGGCACVITHGLTWPITPVLSNLDLNASISRFGSVWWWIKIHVLLWELLYIKNKSAKKSSFYLVILHNWWNMITIG